MQEEIYKEALVYFKEDSGFDRLFNKLKEKFEIYEKELAGTVIIDNPTSKEKEALSGFMKKNYSKSKNIQIKVARFQERLDDTKFAGIKVKVLVEKYFNMRIITKKHKRQVKQEKQEDFFNQLLKSQEGKRSYKILKEVMEERNETFGILKMEYNLHKEIAKNALVNACMAINNLPNKKMSLPVFSAQILKNPHELDRTNITGRIFLSLLSKEQNMKKPRLIEELSEFYYNNNLLIDDLSNMVLCKNIIGKKEGKIHVGWKGFVDNNEPMQVTLLQLSNIDEVKLNLPYAIVVENPAVFSELSMSTRNIGLVCTYGQVKLSGLILLELLKKSGTQLYYSGDIDPEGIQIADRLKQRFKESITLFGFDEHTYIKNLSNVVLNKSRLKKLESISTQELKELADFLRFEERAAYEEKNIDAILKLASNLEN